MATDLHERIKAAIEARLGLAERTRGQWSGVWRWEEGFGDKCNDPTCEYGSLIDEVGDPRGGALVLMSVHGYETRRDWQGAEHIAANDPAFTILACRADLERLERHKPYWFDLGGRHCTTCGFLADPELAWPCPEVDLLAAVYLEATE